jgi:hypothetical protein
MAQAGEAAMTTSTITLHLDRQQIREVITLYNSDEMPQRFTWEDNDLVFQVDDTRSLVMHVPLWQPGAERLRDSDVQFGIGREAAT